MLPNLEREIRNQLHSDILHDLHRKFISACFLLIVKEKEFVEIGLQLTSQLPSTTTGVPSQYSSEAPSPSPPVCLVCNHLATWASMPLYKNPGGKALAKIRSKPRKFSQVLRFSSVKFKRKSRCAFEHEP